MAKYDVSELEDELITTRKNYQGQRGERTAQKRGKPLTVGHVRIYCNKALFLCREIRRLKKRLARYE